MIHNGYSTCLPHKYKFELFENSDQNRHFSKILTRIEISENLIKLEILENFDHNRDFSKNIDKNQDF